MSPLTRNRDADRRRSHLFLGWAPLLLVGFLLGASGCRDQIHVATMPSIAPWVAPELQGRLDDAGRFAVDWRTPPDSIRFVTPEEALSSATARIHRVEGYQDTPRRFHGNRFSPYETEHGDLVATRSMRAIRVPVLPGEAIDFERVELVRGSIRHEGRERHFPCQRPVETNAAPDDG